MPSLDLIRRLGMPIKFPDFFPPGLEEYRLSRSTAAGTPDEFAAAYMLAAAATAIGANVSACVQSSWCVRANLFLMLIGYKGSGKSTLAEHVFASLVAREEAMNVEACDDSEDDDDVDSLNVDEPPRPCLIINDATGPAILELLESNERQLLVNTDEISALFKRNGSGADRQLWCELYDGRRRRKHRVTDRHQTRALQSPYVSLVGTIQPPLLRCAYNERGDDGMLDRLLMVGLPHTQLPSWPDDADDPRLNKAWEMAMERLLDIELLATDAVDGRIDVRFVPAAIAVLRESEDDIKNILLSMRLPEEQYGVVAKIRGHAVRLALLHRCLRWAVGEFGEDGPLGNIDEVDARAARDAAIFFLGRWLIWRPELTTAGPPTPATEIGLIANAGDDPALHALASTAAASRSAVHLIERLIRTLRRLAGESVSLTALLESGPMATTDPDELRGACEWLVANGHATWVQGQAAICLRPAPRDYSTPAPAAGGRGRTGVKA